MEIGLFTLDPTMSGNVYTRERVPLPKISADCPEVEHTGILCTFKYDHGDCRVLKIAIC